MALGIYNTTQSLGLFVGGALGGVLAQHWGSAAVFALTSAVVALWLAVAMSMRAPPVIALREFAIAPQLDIESIRRELAQLPGVREAVVVAERRMAYLKVNLDGWDERRVRQLLGGGI